MRAKRSKKYRKLMHQYETTFGFRDPYQVLLDSHFLQAVHSFKMDLIPALERTLQGQPKPFITKCTLAAIMASSQSKFNNPHFRPAYLPPPTICPLRYCSHNEEGTPIDEADCLIGLLSPNPEAKKNKEHYILATADPVQPAEEKETSGNGQRRDQHRQRAPPPPPQIQYNLRRNARTIPGVPIIYVKRSVMILEPMSGKSTDVREGVERGKLKTGVVSGKRKREAEDGAPSAAAKGAKKLKGANPLSMKKPKSRVASAGGSKPRSEAKEGAAATSKETTEPQENDGEQTTKTKRKRKHKSSKADGEAQQQATPTAVES